MPTRSSSPTGDEALHYEVGVRELDGEDDEADGGEQKFSSAHVWLAPGTHAPLRLEAQVFVGQVYAELVPPAQPEAGS